MRIASTGDLHFHRDHYDETAASLRTIAAEHKRNPFDLIAIAGDIWDGPVQNTAGARFADFLALIAELADVAPVVMIYGTPTHDTEGSLEVFEQIQAAHQIVILRPGRAYALGSANADIYDLSAEVPRDPLKLLLFGVPEPNKKWLLANQTATGKDEADAMVRQAMQGLFLGLGGMRKEHADLPCVLLYHGQVSGAKSGTGYECTSGLMASKDDLAMAGADFYALSDIHEPQQIGTMPAYYPGSIYPKNFGETHKAGCNVVEITKAAPPPELAIFGSDDFKVEVSRLDFPHPQRIKFSIKTGDSIPWDPPSESIDGKMVWLEYTCPRGEEVDTDFWLRAILRDGALPGSRVTLNVLPTETVRAGDIGEKKTLREKVVVYAENSSLDTTEAILKKADELEREAAAAGVVQSGAHFRIDRLRLRGAIGIWKKSRKDEIDLDLEALGPGVLAFASPNGAGKTTILENMHPWSSMLTRDGTMKSHFRLKDSCRDLYLTDERSGYRYRALINIRADIDSGTAEYWLYRDSGDGKGFVHLPGISGRKEQYDEAVAATFGSLALYLKTAFVTQRPSKLGPDLWDATQRERKALIGELMGTDYLDRYRLESKARADTLDDEAKTARATVAAAAGIEDELRTIGESIASATQREEEATTLQARSIAAGRTLKAEREASQARVQGLERVADRKAGLEREIAELLARVEASEREALGFRTAADRREQAQKELSEYEALASEAAALKADKAGVDEQNRAALVAAQAAQAAVNARRREAQAALDAKRRELAELDRVRAGLTARVSAPIAEHCPTCAQLLPEEKRAHLQEERARLEAEGLALIVKYGDLAQLVSMAEGVVAGLEDLPPPVPAPFPGDERLHVIERAIDWADPAALRETIRKADEAAVRIETATTRAAEARGQVATKRLEADALDIELATLPSARAELAERDRLYEAEKASYTNATAAMAAARSSIEAETRAQALAASRLAARDLAAKEIERLGLEAADWRFLERACGPDGIQALELDALAPGIADIANRLLAASGNTGRIEFRTTRIGGKGARTKQIEDFLVYYIDEAGEEQEIATLSGGESVWIRKALYDAFAVIRARNTGVKFQTVFLDEADGALDPESRMRYLRMLEAEHREAGRFQTLLVTHSVELQAMVSQTINVADLGPRETKKEEVAA